MVKKYTANVYNWLKTKLNITASNIKMNGTQSAGSSDLIARADHVHPVDTSRAPTSHKSTGTSYGVSDASNYGHAMASGTTPKVDGTAAVGSETAKFARGDHVHPTDTSRASSNHSHGSITNAGAVGTTANKPLITGTNGAVSAGDFEATATNIKMNGTQSVGSRNTFARGDHVHPTDTSRAPTSHKSTGTSYGVSDASNYGHAKASGTTPKMNGTAAVGSETGSFARGDHVHPTDASIGEFIPSTHNSSTSDWTGVSTNIQSLKVGTMINYYLKQNPTTTPVTLNLTLADGTTTGAKTVYCGYNILSDEFWKYSVISLVYDGYNWFVMSPPPRLDKSLSDTSIYPVQNKVITNAMTTKQNAVETQAKVTQFTNKDRIHIHKLMQYIDPYIDDTHYYDVHLWMGYSNYNWIDDKCPGIGIGVKCILSRGRSADPTIDGVNYTLKKTDGTVLLTSTTDSSTYSWDSLPSLGVGIHYLYAEVNYDDSVWKSNILTVFVKDTNNKFSHNLWSGGEYLNTPGVAGTNVTSITTNELSYIGENSIKTLIKNIGSDAYIEKESQLEFNENGKSVSFQCYIYTIKDVSLRIYYRVNGSYQVQSVEVPAGSDGLFSVAASIPSTADIIKYRISFIDKTADACLYTDNWSLTVS